MTSAIPVMKFAAIMKFVQYHYYRSSIAIVIRPSQYYRNRQNDLNSHPSIWSPAAQVLPWCPEPQASLYLEPEQKS